MALPWIRKGVKREDVDTKLIASLLQPRCEVLGDIPEQLDFIDELPDYSTDLDVSKKMKTNEETSLEICVRSCRWWRPWTTSRTRLFTLPCST